MSNIYYVYIYYHNNIPIYVGKGKGKRYTEHLSLSKKPPKKGSNHRFLNKLRQLNQLNITPTIKILQKNLDETTAFLLEKETISKFGRKDLNTGSLYNLSEGGQGGFVSPKKNINSHQSVAYRLECSKRVKQWWDSNPKQKNILSKKIQNTFKNPKRRKINSDYMNSLTVDERNKRTKSLKKYYNNPKNKKLLEQKNKKISNTLKTTSAFVTNNPKSKSIQTPKGPFSSKRQAIKANNITSWKLDKLLIDQPNEYYYL